MKSYKIEGDINFFAELYKSLDVKENETNTDEDDNLCLITNEPLTDKYVTLKCGHKFNYLPLFNDAKTHKQKFNALEINTRQLKVNELRCPYCRTKQNDLLPYYEDLGVSKIHGVNFIDPVRLIPKIKNPEFKCCDYLTLNTQYNPDGDNPTETNVDNTGNCKYFKCHNGGYYELSKFIENYNGPYLSVCYYHKIKSVKEDNKALKEKKKHDEKVKKEEAKHLKKELLLKVKQEKLNAKKKAKETKDTTDTTDTTDGENIIIFENITNTSLSECCIEVLKNGPKKGNPCGCKVYQENKCKRHQKKEVSPNKI